MRPPAVDALAAERDRARAWSQVPHHRPQRGGLAGAVAADETDDLAGADLQRHASQDVARLDVDVDPADGQHQVWLAPAPADHHVHQPLVGLDVLRRRVGEDLALVEGDDAVGIAEDDVHVVFHLDDRLEPHGLGGAHQGLHDARLVGGAHAARRLVEQDDLRAQGEGGRHVEQLLVALRQVARERPAPVAEAEQLRDLEGVGLHLVVAGEGGEEPAAAAEPRRHRRLQRLQHREVREDLHELEAARHAELRQPHGTDARDVALLEADGARRGTREPGEQVDERGLPRAVRADDRDELAGVDAEAHAVQRAELAVVLREVLRAEDHAGRRATRPRRPPGAKMTSAARIAPNTSRQNGTTDITKSWR